MSLVVNLESLQQKNNFSKGSISDRRNRKELGVCCMLKSLIKFESLREKIMETNYERIIKF